MWWLQNGYSIATALIHLSPPSPFPSHPLFLSLTASFLPMPQTPWRPTQNIGRFPSFKEFADLETNFALQESSSHSKIRWHFLQVYIGQVLGHTLLPAVCPAVLPKRN